MKTLCVIPARLDSSRLPGKLLLADTGKPLICHTVEQALQCDSFNRVVVATGDPEIAEAVADLVEVVDTADIEKAGVVSFRNGTERVAHAASFLSPLGPLYDLVVGLQGDEPLIAPESLHAIVEAMYGNGVGVPYGTLVRQQTITIAERLSSDVVQAFCRRRKLYYSGDIDILAVERFLRGGPHWIDGLPKVHIGVYAWWPKALELYAQMDQSEEEQKQSLEQLRCSSKNWPCLAVEVHHEGFSINSGRDYLRFVSRIKGTP